jgi:hypothetical protein
LRLSRYSLTVLIIAPSPFLVYDKRWQYFCYSKQLSWPFGLPRTMKILFISSPAGGRGRGEGGMNSDGIPLTCILSPQQLGERVSPAPLCINQRIRDAARRQVRGCLFS